MSSNAEMWKFMSPSVTLCSIVPWKMVTKRYTWGGWPHEFVIEAVRPGDPMPYRLLKLDSTFDSRADPHEPHHAPAPFPKPAHQQALDILEDLIGTIIKPEEAEGATPGLGIIAGEAPTPAELEQLKATQVKYLRALVSEADKWWMSGSPQLRLRVGGGTGQRARALEYLVSLGLDNYDGHEWYSGAKGGTKKCYACSEAIPMEATVCKHCKMDLVDLFIRRMKNPPETDPALLKEVQELRGRMAQAKAKEKVA